MISINPVFHLIFSDQEMDDEKRAEEQLKFKYSLSKYVYVDAVAEWLKRWV